MSRAIPTAALLALLTIPISAQPPFSPGTRVRVFTTADSLTARGGSASGAWVVGTIVSSALGELVLKPAPLSEPIVLQTREILRVDVSRGRPNQRRRGATIGGLVSGGAFVALSCWFSDGSCNAGDNVGGFLGYFAVGAVPGVFVGGALGARRQGPERWQQVWAGPPTPALVARSSRNALQP